MSVFCKLYGYRSNSLLVPASEHYCHHTEVTGTSKYSSSFCLDQNEIKTRHVPVPVYQYSSFLDVYDEHCNKEDVQRAVNSHDPVVDPNPAGKVIVLLLPVNVVNMDLHGHFKMDLQVRYLASCHSNAFIFHVRCWYNK